MGNSALRAGVTNEVRRAIYARDGGRCAYCKREVLPFGTPRPQLPLRLHELSQAYFLHGSHYHLDEFDPAKGLITTPEIVAFLIKCQAARLFTQVQLELSEEWVRWKDEQRSLASCAAYVESHARQYKILDWQREQENEARRAVHKIADRLLKQYNPSFPSRWLTEGRQLAQYRRTMLDLLPAIDHITPVIRGGSDEESNLALSCGPCNGQKGQMTLAEWEQWKAYRLQTYGVTKSSWQSWEIMLQDYNPTHVNLMLSRLPPLET